MLRRRVLLRLPEPVSSDVLALAQAIRATLEGPFQIHLEVPDSFDDDSFDDVTPVEAGPRQPLVLTIEDLNAPDGARRANHGD